MKRKKITQYRLIKEGIVDTKTLARLKKNENITVITLERICRALDCDISQVVKLEPDEEDGGSDQPPDDSGDSEKREKLKK